MGSDTLSVSGDRRPQREPDTNHPKGVQKSRRMVASARQQANLD